MVGSGFECLVVSSQMKSAVAEERRIQQQIVAQQKKELTAFLDNQKKEYRLCKDKIKEVDVRAPPRSDAADFKPSVSRRR